MTDTNRSTGTTGTSTSGSSSSSSSSSNSSNAGGSHGFTDDVRQRAIDAYDSARDTASTAGRRAGETLDESPLIALGAGLAVGALIAAFLPTSRRERELLGPYGDRVSRAARDASEAARNAGSEKLRELGLTPDTLADKATEAAKATAQAAVGTFREEASTGQPTGSTGSSGSTGSTGGTGRGRNRGA